MKKNFKIALGIPTNRLIKPKTVKSLLEMTVYSASKYELYFIISTRGYNTSENRNYIAAQAIKNNCDYLFFIDDDMIFPSDVLEQLLNHKKDIVGGVYKTKYEIQDDVIEYLGEKKEGIFECKAVGTGCMLINCDVFKKLPQPWFKYEWFENGMIKRSHDWIFCEDAKNNGFKVWADKTLEVKHIGLKEF